MKELELIDLPGVGESTAEKLANSGYSTVMSVAVCSPAQLVGASGIGESAARKIINYARNNLNLGFSDGQELLEKRENVIKLTTGAESFNELIGGGVESGGITECYGQFGSGKTALAHALAVNCTTELKGTVIWIDTENTFRPERIKEICESRDIDFNDVLSNIKVVRAFNSDHQMFVTDKISEMISKDNVSVKLVIVDSLMSHFRAEYVGRGTLANRQQKLNQHMHSLMRLADVHNLIVYVTNQVMSRPDVFFGDPTVSIGGNIVAHNSTTRLYLRRAAQGNRVAKLVDSPWLPDGEALWRITAEGIVDV